MNKSRQLIKRIDEMKSPKDFYLHHYWRDLSNDEKKRLDSDYEQEQPWWLDLPIKGNWEEWEKVRPKCERVLKLEMRKQLRDLIDWSNVERKLTLYPGKGKSVSFEFPIRSLNVSSFRESKIMDTLWQGRTEEKWKSILNRAGFTNPYNYGSLSASLIGNDQNYNLPTGALINRFSIVFHLRKRSVTVAVYLGPFYNAKVLKLDKMIPKAVWAIKQMITVLDNEIKIILGTRNE